MKRKLQYCVLIFVLQCSVTFAQQRNTIRKILTAITTHTDTAAIEKLYLQTDKPYYNLNDTLWLKAYLFDAAYLTAPAKSGLAYVEVANEQNLVIKRVMLAMSAGLGWGSIVLIDKDFPQGNYTLRAYTNWMRNYDEHYIFTKQFYISAPAENDLLISSRFDTKTNAGKEQANISLKLTGLDGEPVLLNDYRVKIASDKRNLFSDKVHTSMDGTINFNFDLPEKADPHKLAISLQNLSKNITAAYQLPVLLNRPEHIDLQFMPEGGYLTAGINAHVAFKALSEDGNGISAAGAIYNSRQQQVVGFSTSHLGMGMFDLIPVAGETYTAKIKLGDGTYSKSYPLPLVRSSGIGFNVINKLADDSLLITISATPDIRAAGLPYYLVAQARGIACYGATIKLDSPLKNFRLSKSFFPTGVTRFTLLDLQNHPLNERIIYIDRHDELNLQVKGIAKRFTTRDSVGLSIKVTDKDGQPVAANLSIAVTDNGQVKTDSLKSTTIRSSMLLTSDLKGNVEEPGYYFPTVMTAAIWQHLDNLLLTQGWVNYDWGRLFQSGKPVLYSAENNFTISGKVTNIVKGVENARVTLLSKKPALIIDTVTNKAGIFNFTNIYPSDTATYFISAKNKKGKSGSLDIEVNEFKPPVFTALQTISIPWYMNIDTSKLKAINNSLAYKNDREKLLGPNVLKEVNIRGKFIIKDSHNLNEDGGADFIISTKDIEKAGRVTLGELLLKRVKGLLKKGDFYYLNGRFVYFIVDGIEMKLSFSGRNSYAYNLYIESYLSYFNAQDIKGIEVMGTTRNVIPYYQKFLSPSVYLSDYAFIEITTYSGHGPFMRHAIGTYLYRPIEFASNAQFYSPKYAVKSAVTFADTRSTIYWAPNIITDKNGEATLSFYTADKPGSYSILINGSDMNGSLLSGRKKLIIK